jgi:adiponectin receptor
MEEKIVSIKEAPEWMVDNHDLLTGYRLNFKTPKRLLRTMFMKHNELLNIWTHLIGSLIFIGFLIFIICYKPKNDMIVPLWVSNFKNFFNRMAGSLFNLHKDAQGIYKNENGEVLSTNVSQLNFFIDYSKKNWLAFSVGLSKILFLTKNQIESWELAMLNQFDFSFSELIKQILTLSSKENQLSNSLLNSNSPRSQNYNLYTNSLIEKILNSINNLQSLLSSISFKLFRNKDITKIMNNEISEKQDLISAETPFDAIKDDESKDKPLEMYPIWIFCLCAFSCLFLSTIFHIFYPMSCKVNRTLQRLDHAGISLLNFGSSFSLFFYFFYCNTFFKLFYSIFIFVACFSVFFISLLEVIHRPEYTNIKSFMYAALGLTNIVPFIHMAVLSYYAAPHNPYIPFNISFFLIFLMAVIYLVGLAIYTFHIPEKFFPKTFDIWMNSHTIWHVMVFAAAAVHYLNLLIIYETRVAKTCIM